MEYERLAFDAALRALDKQEALLDELRSRTGALLAASALAASFLGGEAFKDPSPVPAAVALIAFVTSIGAWPSWGSSAVASSDVIPPARPHAEDPTPPPRPQPTPGVGLPETRGGNGGHRP